MRTGYVVGSAVGFAGTYSLDEKAVAAIWSFEGPLIGKRRAQAAREAAEACKADIHRLGADTQLSFETHLERTPMGALTPADEVLIRFTPKAEAAQAFRLRKHLPEPMGEFWKRAVTTAALLDALPAETLRQAAAAREAVLDEMRQGANAGDAVGSKRRIFDTPTELTAWLNQEAQAMTAPAFTVVTEAFSGQSLMLKPVPEAVIRENIGGRPWPVHLHQAPAENRESFLSRVFNADSAARRQPE
jgi:hypothetical protein